MIHVDGRVNPVEDVATINFELALSDLLQVERENRQIEERESKGPNLKVLKAITSCPFKESHRKSTRSNRT